MVSLLFQRTERQVERELLGVEGAPRWECRDGERAAGRGEGEGHRASTTTVTARCDKQWLESLSRSDRAATLECAFAPVCVCMCACNLESTGHKFQFKALNVSESSDGRAEERADKHSKKRLLLLRPPLITLPPSTCTRLPAKTGGGEAVISVSHCPPWFESKQAAERTRIRSNLPRRDPRKKRRGSQPSTLRTV